MRSSSKQESIFRKYTPHFSPPISPRTSKALSQISAFRRSSFFPPLSGASVDDPKDTHAFEVGSLLTALSLRPKRSDRSFPVHYEGYQSTRLSVPYESLTSMSNRNAARKMTLQYFYSHSRKGTHTNNDIASASASSSFPVSVSLMHLRDNVCE